MSRRALLLLLGATIHWVAAPTDARAQAPGNESALTIRASRRDTIVASATMTAAFLVTSRRPNTVEVRPRVELPKEWTVLTGGSPIDLAPNSMEMLMLSIVVPSRAAAGVYPVRVWVTSAADPRGVADSVLVRVAARRALDVALLDRPGYVVSGNAYQTSFLVRNRGNIAGEVRITGKSALSAVTISDTLFQLEADQSRVVRVSSATRAGLHSATDDVLEIAAFQSGAAEPSHASARITVVPEPTRKIESFQRLPARVHLRAASSDGVSPFEIFGNGRLTDGGSVNLDFVMRGPTGNFSAFGERDEYRAELRAPSWRARVGDQLFMLSSLTGSGQPGFGIGADGERGMLSFGAYGQEFRRSPEKGREAGAFLTVAPRADSRLALNMVNRTGGALPGRIASGVASLDREYYGAVVELARSRGTEGAGMAHTARVHVGVPDFSLDIGHRGADTTFSGAQRGAEHMYMTGYARVSDGVAFNVSGSRQEADLSRTTGVPYVEQFDLGSISTTLFNHVTFEAGTITRSATVLGVTQTGTQRTVRGRTDQLLPFGTVTLDVEAGRATTAASPDGGGRVFTDASLGLRRSLAWGSVGSYVERYSGGGVTKGIDPTITAGGDATVRVGRGTYLSLMGYATRMQRVNAAWHSQLDGLISQTLRNGSSITFRTRLMGGGTLEQRDRVVGYLEYGIPLSLPVSKLRTPGRVYGRVVDATSGQGVPNALVRLGPQVAITDNSGQVAFGGVPGGEHRLSMSQETSFANAVFVGEPTLMVDSLRPSPTTFTLAIARSARVNIDVRRFILARTGVRGGGGAVATDSLSDAGALANATIMLIGARDTLYRTTNESGKVSFRDIPPGDWVVSIRGDAPAYHRFEPDRLELTLGPGESRDIGFRLIPRRREVQIIGEGEELHPIQAAPAGQAPAAGAKVIKPVERIKQDR